MTLPGRSHEMSALIIIKLSGHIIFYFNRSAGQPHLIGGPNLLLPITNCEYCPHGPTHDAPCHGRKLDGVDRANHRRQRKEAAHRFLSMSPKKHFMTS